MSTLCIAFDLDDTLYLERDYVQSGFDVVGDWVAATLGMKHFAENARLLFEQGERGSVFQSVLKHLGREPEPLIVSKMVDIYRNHEPKISMLPDASECLARLRDQAVLSIITDGPLASQRAKCRKLRLEEFCKFIVLTDEWGAQFHKPHLRAFEFVRSQTGPGSFEFIYVADNPAKDFNGPLALGWDTVRVRRPGGLHFAREAMPAAQPRVEIGDLSLLCDVLGTGVR